MQKVELKLPINIQILADRLVDLINFQTSINSEDRAWFPVNSNYSVYDSSRYDDERELILFSMEGESFKEATLMIHDGTVGRLTLEYAQFEEIVQAIDALDGKTTEYSKTGQL